METTILPRLESFAPDLVIISAGFDAHRGDVATAQRLEQCRGIGRIGLVALDIGAHVARRQQPHLDTAAGQPARPVVRGAARLHHHPLDGTVSEPAFKLPAREAMACGDLPVLIGHGELKDVLCQIDGDGRSIHLGLLSVGLC